TAGARNVIAGNLGNGIGLYNSGVSNTIIRGNYICVAAGGNTAQGTTPAGVWIADSSDNTVGGPNAADANRIAFNTQVGVGMTGAAVRNRVLSNPIFANVGPGIDLQFGANNSLATPALQNAHNNSNTVVDVDLSALPAGNYTVQFFANVFCDGSGFGEGERLVGTRTIAQPGSAGVALDELVPVGQFITATATDSTGNTSKF